jgi:hypothetical protein
MSNYFTTDQQHYLLIAGDDKQLWRHSFTAPYFLYDIRNGQLTPLVGIFFFFFFFSFFFFCFFFFFFVLLFLLLLSDSQASGWR